MSGFSHYPLQKAVYGVLTGNAPLMALVSGIFDRAPQNTPYPYITLGESTGDDWSSKTTTGMEHKISLHAWSREGGRMEAALIMQNIHALLHDANFAVDGQTLVMMRFSGSAIMLENDGFTYQGTIRFTALLQAN